MPFTPISTFLTNLKTLGFDKSVHCRGIYAKISFEPFILNTRSFEATSHFLFRSLDKSRTKVEFKTCWPPRTKEEAREYNQIAFRWLNELRQIQGSLLALIPLRKSYFEDCHHPTMSHIMLAFSALVLNNILSRFMEINVDILDKETVEKKLKYLSDKVAKTIDTIHHTKIEWRKKGQDILKELDRATDPSNQNPILKKPCFTETKVELDRTLYNIRKRKLLKIKSSRGLRKNLAEILGKDQEAEPLYVLPSLPRTPPPSKAFTAQSPRELTAITSPIAQSPRKFTAQSPRKFTAQSPRAYTAQSPKKLTVHSPKKRREFSFVKDLRQIYEDADQSLYAAEEEDFAQNSCFFYTDSVSLLANEEPPSGLDGSFIASPYTTPTRLVRSFPNGYASASPQATPTRYNSIPNDIDFPQTTTPVRPEYMPNSLSSASPQTTTPVRRESVQSDFAFDMLGLTPYRPL